MRVKKNYKYALENKIKVMYPVWPCILAKNNAHGFREIHFFLCEWKEEEMKKDVKFWAPSFL